MKCAWLWEVLQHPETVEGQFSLRIYILLNGSWKPPLPETLTLSSEPAEAMAY